MVDFPWLCWFQSVDVLYQLVSRIFAHQQDYTNSFWMMYSRIDCPKKQKAVRKKQNLSKKSLVGMLRAGCDFSRIPKAERCDLPIHTF